MKYRKLQGYKYQVAERVSIALPLLADAAFTHPLFTLAAGQLTIEAGYCWDGASGPTWDDATNMTPSLVHDVLYQAIRCGLLSPDRRPDCDYALSQLAQARGMPAWRRLLWFNGLALFGFNAAKLRKSEAQDEVFTAP